ncbi:MAG TPA: spore protease YyaC [Peptococcaceae bacterium]|nr:spore protease YyaC [Peptococcaceae bacterium]
MADLQVLEQVELEQVESEDKTRIHVQDAFAAPKLAHDLCRRLRRLGFRGGECVLLCIGTDRSTGDCLGPLVGWRLSKVKQGLFAVYGTLEEPVHAVNLEDKLAAIKIAHPGSLVIAVDACLGSPENVGSITVGDGALEPGAGVKKKLPLVGDIHITGVVNVGGYLEYVVLQNTRLSVVMRMAGVIVEGLKRAAQELTKHQAQGA